MNAIGVESNVDALRREYLLNDPGCVLIFVPRESRALFHNRDPAAKAPEDLRKLQADVSAADHDKMLR
jgi:hypothetical protein